MVILYLNNLRGVILLVHNNKNHKKTDDITNAEMRKMFPKGGEDIGVKNGVKIGSYANSKDHTRE